MIAPDSVQGAVLDYIKQNPGADVPELEEALYLERPAITRAVNALKAEHLIKQRRYHASAHPHVRYYEVSE